ncbi:hypothetical protein KVR01_012899 [Diaporthe batatas]|uniref:uncharacterized protein n=1 Tax=Diaporthe batatas TaxID=748121 RepID=UPI001D04F471|nr:uncharacterized protein KVR01_012899 [Diaporthe batatas]KAG8157191.1 hypothetical protein KVR01_012899 [Diaporthe batatas]
MHWALPNPIATLLTGIALVTNAHSKQRHVICLKKDWMNGRYVPARMCILPYHLQLILYPSVYLSMQSTQIVCASLPGPIAHKLIKRPSRRLVLYGVLFVVLVFVLYHARLQSSSDQVRESLRDASLYILGYTRYDFKPTLIEQQCFDGAADRINANNLTDAIPETIHFIWTGNSEITFKLYLAVRAALVSAGIPDIRLHHDTPLNSANAWLRLLRPDLTLVPFETRDYLAGVAQHHPEAWTPSHQTDAMRLHVMLAHGGVYLDSDAYVLRPLASLLRGARDVYMGYEGGNRMGLCDGVILAKAGAPFIARRLGEYATFDDGNWNYHSVLAARHPDEICTLSPSAFFWPLWDRAAVDWMHAPLGGGGGCGGGGVGCNHGTASEKVDHKQKERPYVIRPTRSCPRKPSNVIASSDQWNYWIEWPGAWKGENPPFAQGLDKSNTITMEQPSMAPTVSNNDANDATATGNGPEPKSKGHGAGRSEASTTFTPSHHRHPVKSLHAEARQKLTTKKKQKTVQRTYTAQADLTQEAIVLLETIRDTLANYKTLVGYLSGNSPDVLGPFGSQVARLAATTTYLISILGPSILAARAVPTASGEYALLRRLKIQAGQDEAVAQLRHLLALRAEGGGATPLAFEPSVDFDPIPCPRQSHYQNVANVNTDFR